MTPKFSRTSLKLFFAVAFVGLFFLVAKTTIEAACYQCRAGQSWGGLCCDYCTTNPDQISCKYRCLELCNNNMSWWSLTGVPDQQCWYCGDGVCRSGENCSNCPADCGACCTPSYPGAATLVSPANLSTNLDTPITFTWTDSTGWGTGCPQTNRYYLYIKEKSGATCDTAGMVAYAITTSTYATVNLNWGRNYCWLVTKSNGSRTTNSAIWEFTTTPPPVMSNFTLTSPNRCVGVSISGRSEETSTNNPVHISMDVSDPRNDFAAGVNVLREARLAVLPATEQSSSYATYAVLEPLLRNRAGFRVSGLNTGTPTYASVDLSASPWYGSSASSGNLTNTAGTASLLGLNGVTTRVEQISNQALRVHWELRFENTYPSADLSMYASVLSLTPSGNYVSQDPDGANGQNQRFTKSAQAWRTDLLEPNIQISDPQPHKKPPGSFEITWSASDSGTGDSGITDLRSYCYLDTGTMILQDLVYGLINLDATPIEYPQTGNCLVTLANLGMHAYSINSQTGNGDVYFSMYARDGACNEITTYNGIENPVPWILTQGGLTSAVGGYSSIKVKNVPTLEGIVPGLADDSYLSTYSAFSGTAGLASRTNRISKNNYYARDYADAAVKPPVISEYNTWYPYLYGQISQTQTVTDYVIEQIGGSLSTVFAGAPGVTKYVRLTAQNVLVQSGATCDVNAIIFVQGNLAIAPNLLKGATTGCLFIVQGSVAVEGGNYASTGVPSTGNSLYDEVQAMFIIDGTLITTTDLPAGGLVEDGLIFRGGVIAAEVSLGRTLGVVRNLVQPSEVFILNPFYAYTFKSELAARDFSLRTE